MLLSSFLSRQQQAQAVAIVMPTVPAPISP
jgi:hypothetical protein